MLPDGYDVIADAASIRVVLGREVAAAKSEKSKEPLAAEPDIIFDSADHNHPNLAHIVQ